jgi:hypothetical protein
MHPEFSLQLLFPKIPHFLELLLWGPQLVYCYAVPEALANHSAQAAPKGEHRQAHAWWATSSKHLLY